MQELRFVAVSEDGSYAVLAVPGRSGRYILPIDERLRAVAQGQTSRLAQYEIEVESPLRPKEIQARIRAGETAEEIADAAGIPVERVRWFEGPVLAERGYIAQQAQAASVRRAGDSSGPGPRLDDIVTARLSAAGTDPADGQWDSRKRGDGNWQVSLTFPSGGRLHVAEWVFDPRRRHVMPDDDNAARLSLPESELPPEPVSLPGEATVTPIASRLGAAAGMGGGSVTAPGGYAGSSGVSRFRPERSVIPDRSLGGDRSLADRPAPPPLPAPPLPAPSLPAPSLPAPSLPAAERSGGAERADRSGHQERAASYGYAEFPESAPYRASAPAQEPPAYRAPAQEPTAYRPPEPPAYRDAAPESYRPPAAPQPIGYRDPEPAPRRAPAGAEPPAEPVPPAQPAAASVIDDTERVRPTPPRPVVFEDPEPALLGEQLELTPPAPPAQPAQPATSPAAAPATAAAGAPVKSAPAGQEPETEVAATRTAAPAPAEAAAAGQVSAASTEQARPAAMATEQARPAATATGSAAQPATESPGAREAEPAAPAPAAAAAPMQEVPVPAAPPAAEDPSARSRPGAKKNAKGRRSSVPSWDEIMLGSSRLRD